MGSGGTVSKLSKTDTSEKKYEKKLQSEFDYINDVTNEFLNRKIPKGKDYITLSNENFPNINRDDINYVEIDKYTIKALTEFIKGNYIYDNKVDMPEETTILIQYKNNKIIFLEDFLGEKTPKLSNIRGLIVSDGYSDMIAGKVKIYNMKEIDDDARKKQTEPHDLRVDIED